MRGHSALALKIVNPTAFSVAGKARFSVDSGAPSMLFPSQGTAQERAMKKKLLRWVADAWIVVSGLWIAVAGFGRGDVTWLAGLAMVG
jgi:hypothetical protein